jgi:hypothetical protein
MTIAPSYTSTKTVTGLAPDSDRTVDFDTWPAQARGTWTVKCTTQLSADVNQSNDMLQDSVTVNVHDIAAVSIVQPRNNIPIESIIPEAVVHNSGTVRDSVVVVFKIREDSFASTRDLPEGIPVGHDTTIDFDIWYAGTPGSYTSVCSTWSRPDQFAPDNVKVDHFSVAMNDVGVVQVLSPTGSHDSSVAISPSAIVQNYGLLPATFYAYGLIRTAADSSVYRDSLKLTNLATGAETTLTFAIWPKPHGAGSYIAACSTALAGDAVPSNDTLSSAFTITTAPAVKEWISMPPMLAGSKNKNVKDGGCLAYGLESTTNDTGYVYAFKGNGTYEFYRYNTVGNVWISRDSIPAFGALGKKKAVKKGAALSVGTNGKVYGAKGNNTYEFWCYDPSQPAGKHWTQLADVPKGAKALKEGTGLAAVNISGTDYVYLLKGSGTLEFYRYKTSDGSWATMASAPVGASNKPFKYGSSIAYDGNDTIWAMKGSYNELFAYSVSSDKWVSKDTLPKKSSPSAKKTKVKDGSDIACNGRVVYALKGDNTNEFWYYQCDSHRWYTADPLPAGNANKKVKGGGALVYARTASGLFALRGNNTLEFWKYGPVAPGFFALSASRDFKDVQSQTEPRSPRFALCVTPNPFTPAFNPLISCTLPTAGNINLALYDVSGRLVGTLACGYHAAGSFSYSLLTAHYSLASGVYVLRLTSDDAGTMCRKLVIE